MTMLSFFQTSFQVLSQDEELQKSFTLSEPSAKPIRDSSNLRFISTPLQLTKYTKDELYQIFKTILKMRILIPYKDQKDLKEFLEQALKSRTPDFYKGKYHIDYYEFIQQCKDYFAIFGSKNCNRDFFTITFLKKKTLNQQ